MNIELKRKEFTPNSIIGEVFIDDEFFCYSIENPKIGSAAGQDLAIPYGDYRLSYHSPSRFEAGLHSLMKDDKSYKMLCLSNERVPKSRAILIHWGNTAKDTEGCIILGKTKDKDFIGNSKVACYDFYKRLKDEDISKIHFTIVEG